jgi:sugar lactone lactonase YvrE
LLVESVEWQQLTQTPCVLGESPVWSSTEQVLYWIDVRGAELHRYDPQTRSQASFRFGELLGGVVMETGGCVLLAMKDAIHRFDPRSGATARLVALERDRPENRLNEFKCAPDGSLWCGSMWDFGLHVRGSLYRIDSALSVQVLRDKIGIPNGLAFDGERTRVYFADSKAGTIEHARWDLAAGAAALEWNPFGASPLEGRPDGSAIDDEGFLWSVRTGAGCIARIASDGRVDRLLKLPVTHPTACAFGGPGLDVLYVTSSRQRLDADALALQPMAGHLICARPGFRGVREPMFTPTTL